MKNSEEEFGILIWLFEKLIAFFGLGKAPIVNPNHYTRVRFFNGQKWNEGCTRKRAHLAGKNVAGPNNSKLYIFPSFPWKVYDVIFTH